MANDCIPTKQPAETITCQATVAVVGKTFVKISGPRLGGGLRGGTTAVALAGPGYGPNTLSTDLADVYQVRPATVSGEACLGVASQDAAVGGPVFRVYKFGQGLILPITAGAAITAGTEVQTDATGRAIPLAAGKALGYAVDSASGAGVDCEIALY